MVRPRTTPLAVLVKARKRPSALRALSWESPFNWAPAAVMLATVRESSTRLSRGSRDAHVETATSRDDPKGLVIDGSSCPVTAFVVPGKADPNHNDRGGTTS